MLPSTDIYYSRYRTYILDRKASMVVVLPCFLHSTMQYITVNFSTIDSNCDAASCDMDKPVFCPSKLMQIPLKEGRRRHFQIPPAGDNPSQRASYTYALQHVRSSIIYLLVSCRLYFVPTDMDGSFLTLDTLQCYCYAISTYYSYIVP